MADYIQLEPNTDRILLEDDSGLILLESTPPAGEVGYSSNLGVDTWEFDSPEPLVINRSPINYFIASQWLDNGDENICKKIDAVRVTAKNSTNGKLQIHTIEEGEQIINDNLETGTSPDYEVNIPSSSEVVRNPRIKGGPKNASLWSMRYSGTWDGQTDEKDRLDEIVIEFSRHGTKK